MFEGLDLAVEEELLPGLAFIVHLFGEIIDALLQPFALLHTQDCLGKRGAFLLPDTLLHSTDNEVSCSLSIIISIYRNLLHPLPMDQKTMGIDSIGRTGK